MTLYFVQRPVLHRPLFFVRIRGTLMHITAFVGVGYLPKTIQTAEFVCTFRGCQSLHARAVVPSVLHGSQGIRSHFQGNP
jgi:hypothetical protein